MGSDDKNGSGGEEKELEIIKCVIELSKDVPVFWQFSERVEKLNSMLIKGQT